MDLIERPYTPRVVRTLARADTLAAELGHGYIGTEHVILALIDDRNGIAGMTMHQLGVAQAIRAEVLRTVNGPAYSRGDRSIPRE